MSASYISVTKSLKPNELSDEQVDNIKFYKPRVVGPLNLKNSWLGRHPGLALMAALFIVAFVIVLICVIAVAVQRNESKAKLKQPIFEKYDSKEYGLLFFPEPSDETILISFRPMNYVSYHEYYNYLNGFLHDYNIMNQANSEKFVDCNKEYAPSNKVCKFTTARLGEECSIFKEYGYHAGTPCVLLVLNMPPNVKPIPMDSQEVSTNGSSTFSPDDIAVTCKGTTEKDEQLIGKHYIHDIPPIQYFPEKGFPTYYYRNVTGEFEFLHPLVMVKFNTVPDHHFVSITCRAWVKNISVDEQEVYSTKFVIYMH